MKVKVGDKIYDGTDVPIMVILTDEDKQNIANMAPEAHRYAQVPSDVMSADECRTWMHEDEVIDVQ